MIPYGFRKTEFNQCKLSVPRTWVHMDLIAFRLVQIFNQKIIVEHKIISFGSYVIKRSWISV